MADDNDQQPDIRARALELLARREHAPVELEHKLRQRDYPPEQVTAVVEALTAEGWLSAERYAAAVVRTRIARGIGPVRIRAELARMRIDATLIERALTDADADWSALADAARCKRFGAGLPGDYKARTRQMRFLQRRGFDFDCIRAVMHED